MRPLVLALVALLVAAGAAAQTPPPTDGKLPPHSRDKLTELVSKLTAEKLDAVMAANGLEVPKDFYDCLCSNAPRTSGVGSRYVEGQCELSGLGTWRDPLPGDAKVWASCLDAHAYPDGRTLVDVLADAAASRRRPSAATLDTATPGQRLRAEIAALKKVCLPVGDGPDAVIETYDREYLDYLNRREDAAAIAADLPGKTRPRPPPPASQWLVDEMESAIAGAPDPCEQAAEAALVAEKAKVRTLGDYIGALASTWYKPGGDDALEWIGKLKRLSGVLGLVDGGGNLVDIAKEASAQAKHKAYSEAIEEARELIRSSRGWTKATYDAFVEGQRSAAADAWEAIRRAADKHRKRVAEAEIRRAQRPPGPADVQIQYDLTIDNDISQANAEKAVTLTETFTRLDTIKFLNETLERHRKPLLGRTCEQWMMQACGETK